VVRKEKKTHISSAHIAEQNSNNKQITRSNKKPIEFDGFFIYLNDIGILFISEIVIFFNANVPCEIGAKTPFWCNIIK